MSGVNKTILLGRLGRDPELKYTTSGMAICNFSIATSEKNKQGEEKTEWHRCVSFQKTGELIAQYVQKGDELYVEGKISYGKYTNKDGVEIPTADIIVNQMNFISGKKGGGQNQSQQPYGNQGNNQPPQQNQGQEGYNQQQNGGYQNQQPPQTGYNQNPAHPGNGGDGMQGPNPNPQDDEIPF